MARAPFFGSVEPCPVAVVQDELHVLNGVEVDARLFPDPQGERAVKRTTAKLSARVLADEADIGHRQRVAQIAFGGKSARVLDVAREQICDEILTEMVTDDERTTVIERVLREAR